MWKAIKADSYRMFREKRGIVSFLILVVVTILLSNLSVGDKPDKLNLLISNLSGFTPLFFIGFNIFFFGDDFTFRTVNYSVIKQERWQVFLYKVIQIYSWCLIQILLIDALAFFLTNATDGRQIVTIFFNQLPYYLCIISISIFIFNVFDKVYESTMFFTILTLLFDNLVSYFTIDFGEGLAKLYMFLNLKTVVYSETFSVETVLYPVVGTILYLFLSYYLFNKREFK